MTDHWRRSWGESVNCSNFQEAWELASTREQGALIERTGTDSWKVTTFHKRKASMLERIGEFLSSGGYSLIRDKS